MASVNVNWEQLFPTLGITVQPSRWEHFRQKLQHLSRNAVRQWVYDMLQGTPFANVLYLSVDQLRVIYEGVQPVGDVTPEVNSALDLVVSEILGGHASNHLRDYGTSRAAEGVVACNWALDDPTVPRP